MEGCKNTKQQIPAAYGDGHSNNSKEADNCIKIESCIPNCVDIPKLNETSSLNLDETISLTETGSLKTDETSLFTESGFIKLDETSSPLESGFKKKMKTVQSPNLVL